MEETNKTQSYHKTVLFRPTTVFIFSHSACRRMLFSSDIYIRTIHAEQTSALKNVYMAALRY